MKQFFVYFMTNWTHQVLYVGMTNNLERRVYEHKNKLVKGFTKKYELMKLIYFEEFDSAINAIAREKQIKNWARHKKDFLVKKTNPDWRDLADDWYVADPSASLGMTEKCGTAEKI